LRHPNADQMFLRAGGEPRGPNLFDLTGPTSDVAVRHQNDSLSFDNWCWGDDAQRKGDCHGDFKSLGNFCAGTYVDRSTGEVVFFEVRAGRGLQSRERIISAVLMITFRHTGNA
jgi:hypothetical protein